VIIRRFKTEKHWRESPPRKLVFGRRKVGKSFFVKEFTQWDRYFFVLHSGAAVDVESGEELPPEAFKRELKHLLRGEEHVVIDEFGRLPLDVLDLIHATPPEQITLISSSVTAAKEFLGKRSPLLGLLFPFPFSLPHSSELIASLSEHYEDKDLMEVVTVAKEPISLSFLKEPLRSLVWTSTAMPGLLGEVFSEERRTVVRSYEAILEVLAGSVRGISDIWRELSGRGLFSNGPSSLVPYLSFLERTGLVKKVRVYGRGGGAYKVTSPPMEAYFLLRRRTGFPDVPANLENVLKHAEQILPRLVEGVIREFLAEYHGLQEGILLKHRRGEVIEIDVALGDGKIKVLAEVKWRESITKKEVEQIEKKMFGFEAEKYYLVVPDGSSVPETSLEVLDVEKIKEMALKLREQFL